MEALGYVFVDNWFSDKWETISELLEMEEEQQQQPAAESEQQPATESEQQQPATESERSGYLHQAEEEEEEEEDSGPPPPPPEYYEENWEGLLHKWRDGSKLWLKTAPNGGYMIDFSFNPGRVFEWADLPPMFILQLPNRWQLI